MRVLIVDDDMGVSQMLLKLFSQSGLTSDVSHSVADALDFIRQTRYDLAVCDVDLPDGNGITLAHALLKVEPSVRLVMISGDPDNLDKARDSGLSRCLQKPFDLGDLKALLELQETK